MLAIFGAGVAPSFSSLGLALPVGLALPSLGRGRPSSRVRFGHSGRAWPGSDPKEGKPGTAKKGRMGRPGAQLKGKEGKGGLKLGLALPSWGRGWPFLLGVAVVQLCVVIILILITIPRCYKTGIRPWGWGRPLELGLALLSLG